MSVVMISPSKVTVEQAKQQTSILGALKSVVDWIRQRNINIDKQSIEHFKQSPEYKTNPTMQERVESAEKALEAKEKAWKEGASAPEAAVKGAVTAVGEDLTNGDILKQVTRVAVIIIIGLIGVMALLQLLPSGVKEAGGTVGKAVSSGVKKVMR